MSISNPLPIVLALPLFGMAMSAQAVSADGEDRAMRPSASAGVYAGCQDYAGQRARQRCMAGRWSAERSAYR